MQAFGVAAAIAFGVFAVESVRQAEVANGYAAKALEQARVANEVAMLAICMSGSQTKGALLVGLNFYSSSSSLFNLEETGSGELTSMLELIG